MIEIRFDVRRFVAGDRRMGRRRFRDEVEPTSRPEQGQDSRKVEDPFPGPMHSEQAAEQHRHQCSDVTAGKGKGRQC